MKKTHIWIAAMLISGILLAGCSGKTGPLPDTNSETAVLSDITEISPPESTAEAAESSFLAGNESETAVSTDRLQTSTSAPAETQPPAAKQETVISAATTSPQTKAATTKSEKPAVTTQKPAETKATSEFDVAYWVTFVKDYAQSIGLGLDETATGCWDNPTTASAKRIYLERDLKDLLDFYKESGFTAVWVWSEKTGNGEYLIYVGYA